MAPRFRELGDGRVFAPNRGDPPPAPPGFVRDAKNPYLFRPIPVVTNEETTFKELYQHLYEDPMLNYGSSIHNRCPGVKFFDKYRHWVKGKVFDFGSGRGDTVSMLRGLGFYANGMDQVDLDNGLLVGDITQPFDACEGYDTGICIDVFEHLEDPDVNGLLENMSKTHQQVITVHNGPAFEKGCTTDLHINKKSFEAWAEFIEEWLDVIVFEKLGKERGIFFCKK